MLSMSDESSISLNKYISSKGICSRRKADEFIEDGRVQINGKIARKGNRVFEGDKVQLDGRVISSGSKKKAIYMLFNKPAGITCTTDQRDRTNIIDYINYKERIFPIGRLDKNSTGLILLTNDGDIVNKVLRKENRHEKEYIVSVNMPINGAFIKKMSGPIPILGTRTIPAKVTQLKAKMFRIVLTQGLNRQIRRMVEYCGYKVVSLKRVRIMHLKLGDLKRGEWRLLKDKELEQLLSVKN